MLKKFFLRLLFSVIRKNSNKSVIEEILKPRSDSDNKICNNKNNNLNTRLKRLLPSDRAELIIRQDRRDALRYSRVEEICNEFRAIREALRMTNTQEKNTN